MSFGSYYKDVNKKMDETVGDSEGKHDISIESGLNCFGKVNDLINEIYKEVTFFFINNLKYKSYYKFLIRRFFNIF